MVIPGISLVTVPFFGTGFGGWNQNIVVSVIARNKIRFVDGSCPRLADGNPHLRQWDRCNNMVISWLTNSLSPDMAESDERQRQVMRPTHFSNDSASFDQSKGGFNFEQDKSSLINVTGCMGFLSSSSYTMAIIIVPSKRLSDENSLLALADDCHQLPVYNKMGKFQNSLLGLADDCHQLLVYNKMGKFQNSLLGLADDCHQLLVYNKMGIFQNSLLGLADDFHQLLVYNKMSKFQNSLLGLADDCLQPFF
ncbi:hypothetical protein FXO37_09339 [Capsicum annuum]|nr:hypothetical protein FXO37_09339 [Capsicum annuum]